MKNLLLAAAALLIAVPVDACRTVSRESARTNSDVIVTGTGSFDLKKGTGTIRPLRVMKGKVAKSYRVKWAVSLPSDCWPEPERIPAKANERATYYLSAQRGGNYFIMDMVAENAEAR